MTRLIDVRVGTTKVRTGCMTCKQRRIKCDESGMPCQQCLKARRTCGGYASGAKPLRLVQYRPTAAATLHEYPSTIAVRSNMATAASGVFSLTKSIGGLRVDPFNALPIENTSDVQLAFDNLFHLQFEHMGETSRTNYIRTMLGDAMFFEAMIAFSKTAWRYEQPPSQRLSKDIRLHIGGVLQQLCTRLPDCEHNLTPSLILTIYYLLVVHQAAGEIRTCMVHLRGLRQLSKMPPSTESTILDGFMQARLRSAEMVSKFFADKCSRRAIAGQPYEVHYPILPRQSDQYARSNPSIPPTEHVSEVRAACAEESPCSANPNPQIPMIKKDCAAELVPVAFRSLVREGKISSRGIEFLTNIDSNLGRPYEHDSKDRITTMLALRMIESAQQTAYPAHMLMFSKTDVPPESCPDHPNSMGLDSHR